MNTTATPMSKKKWSWSKRFFITLGAIGLLICAVWQYTHWPNYWDDATINDADLLVVPPPAPEKNNAATYIAIQNDLTKNDQEILDRTPIYKEKAFYSSDNLRLSDTAVRAYVTESRVLVQAFVTASKQNVYQCPLSHGQNSFKTDTCNLGVLREYAELAAFHAQYALSINDYGAATLYTESILRFGKLVVNQEMPFGQIDYMVGAAIYRTALDILESSPVLVKMMQGTLMGYEIPSDAPVVAMKSEYRSRKGIVLEFMEAKDSETGHRSTYFHQPYRTINIMADLFRIDIKNLAIDCAVPIDNSAFETHLNKNSFEVTFSSLVKPNRTGRMYLKMLMSPAASSRGLHCEINTRLEALVV
jgi:hypothetical protein